MLRFVFIWPIGASLTFLDIYTTKHRLVLLPLGQILNLLQQPERSSVHSRYFPVSSAQRPPVAAPWRISVELPRHPRAPGGHPHHYQGVCRGPVSGGPASSLPVPPSVSSRRFTSLILPHKLSASFLGFPSLLLAPPGAVPTRSKFVPGSSAVLFGADFEGPGNSKILNLGEFGHVFIRIYTFLILRNGIV